LVYVDETGIDQFLYRQHARALRGKKVPGETSGRKFKRVSIVAGKCGANIIAPLEFDGTADHTLFEFWFEEILLRELTPDHVIVMDNASFHRKAVLQASAEKAGCSVLFLPPYSPDLNPIENFWAWLKRTLRSSLCLFDSLEDALMCLFHVA
jgi:transposase